MEQKQRRRMVNNPFPGQPRALGFVRGSLFFDPEVVPSQVCSVGEFCVHWSVEKGGVLWVEHLAEPGRLLWSTNAGSSFVTAGHGAETVEEYRGSFAVHDEPKLVCRHQTVDDIGIMALETFKQNARHQRTIGSAEGLSATRVDGDGNKLSSRGSVVVVTGILSSSRKLAFQTSSSRGLSRRLRKHAACVRYWLVFSEKRSHHLGFSVTLDKPVSGFSSFFSSSRVHDESEELQDVLDRMQWAWSGKSLRGKGMREEYLSRKVVFQSSKTFSELPSFNRVQLTYSSTKDECFFGFGEQFSCFNLKGRRVPILVQEQGLGRGDQPITAAANLISYRSGGSWHTTYAPSPYYITSELRCVFLENYDYSIFDLQQDDRVQIQVYGGSMEGRILHGRTPTELLQRYTEAVGRMRELPGWILEGAVVGMQGGSSSVRETLQKLKEHQVPVAAFWLQDWVGQRKTSIGSQLWWNWEADLDHYNGWEDLVTELKSEGIRTMTYCNPLLASVSLKKNKRRDLLHEATEQKYLVHGPDLQPYMIKNTSFDAGMIDLTNPAARDWLKDILRAMIRTGIRGWMADFGEALPFDSVLFSGESPAQLHNKYPEMWAELNREIVEEWQQTNLASSSEDDDGLVFFTRAGYRESPRWSTLFWEGDQMVSWQKNDGIKSAIVGLLSSGISGFSLNHSDIGGYTTVNIPFVKYVRSEELLIRWMELNAFSVVFRTHEGNDPEANSQFYSNSTTMYYFARCALLYKAWESYRKQLVKEAAACGLPVVRHMFLHYPEDEYVRGLSYQQFLVGSEMLVVPVVDKQRRRVLAYFPAEDSWEHIWTRKTYSFKRGSKLWIEAPLGFPAVFIRSSATDIKSKFYHTLEHLQIL